MRFDIIRAHYQFGEMFYASNDYGAVERDVLDRCGVPEGVFEQLGTINKVGEIELDARAVRAFSNRLMKFDQLELKMVDVDKILEPA
jgi:hypothetical protein